jgi:hypothetical protein
MEGISGCGKNTSTGPDQWIRLVDQFICQLISAFLREVSLTIMSHSWEVKPFRPSQRLQGREQNYSYLLPFPILTTGCLLNEILYNLDAEESQPYDLSVMLLWRGDFLPAHR